jgi:hypothetical protein
MGKNRKGIEVANYESDPTDRQQQSRRERSLACHVRWMPSSTVFFWQRLPPTERPHQNNVRHAVPPAPSPVCLSTMGDSGSASPSPQLLPPVCLSCLVPKKNMWILIWGPNSVVMTGTNDATLHMRERERGLGGARA